MKITIIGTGYVGLVSGACFAETGVIVSCVDISEGKIKKLKEGIIPIYEPGLEVIVKRNLEKGRLSFTTNLEEGLKESEAVFIAVGTPPGEDGSADLQHVLSAAANIGKLMKGYLVIVTKSTVPIGTSEKIRETVKAELKKRGKQIPFDVASNPEFLKEGAAVDDFLRPNRIIVGVNSKEAKKIMERIYKPFLLNGHPLIFMDVASAELTKYAANSMLATRISFMNDIANLCELVGADVNSVRKGIGSDPRIGNKFIYPGMGYGGSCFPKDVKAIIRTAESYGYPLKVIRAVEEVNNFQKEVIYLKIKEYFKGDLKDKIFGIWGLSFKPNTDDIREAPSLVLIQKLLEQGARIKAYDPVAMEEVRKLLGNKIEYSSDLYEAAIDIDALILVTEWSEFRIPNYKVLSRLMKQKIIFDGRNIYEPVELKELGFRYFCIGRKIKTGN